MVNACLEKAAASARALGLPVQTPASIPVDKLGSQQEVNALMQQHGIHLPCIVKPRVACGTPEAHHMALILHDQGFTQMQASLFCCVLPSSILPVLSCSGGPSHAEHQMYGLQQHDHRFCC